LGVPRYTSEFGGQAHCASFAKAAIVMGMGNLAPAPPSSPLRLGGARRARPRWQDRMSEGLVATGKGLVFVGLVVATAALWVILCLALAFSVLGIGLLLIPPTLLAMRRLANVYRRASAAWCGVTIAVPYRAYADGRDKTDRDRGEKPEGIWRHSLRLTGRLCSDPATWRDLLWFLLDPSVGWVLYLMPLALVLWGLFGLAMPGIHRPLQSAGWDDWYGFVPVKGETAWLCVPLGLVFIWLGLRLAPWLLHTYGRFASALLAPTPKAALALQVGHLTKTRAEALDSSAAELRRIERDLHDGAQARLVAMGMTLGAAEQLVVDNPAAARALLIEAKEASAKALAELRDLVRGVHPPVLADRGLVDAVRALALDSPLEVNVTSDLNGRPPAPIESAVYFAVSELLANASKHSGARHVSVELRHSGSMLRALVSDDGSGGADPDAGSGLQGIERRLATFDGVLVILSPVGGPTTITIDVPCELSSPKTSSS
jgi:signal transduction histidine kinase